MKTTLTSTQMIKHIVKFSLIVLLGISLCACSKTVQWEEEVPLNNGETIWVKRTVVYVLKGGAGNPFDVDYRPKWDEKLEFTWNGNHYIYDGEARVFLLAISPQKQPMLIARPGDK